MPTTSTDSSPTVVEVLITGPGIGDVERFELPDDRSARAFARDVMAFALDPTRGRRRPRSTNEAGSRAQRGGEDA
jgi:hypothetical protein